MLVVLIESLGVPVGVPPTKTAVALSTTDLEVVVVSIGVVVDLIIVSLVIMDVEGIVILVSK